MKKLLFLLVFITTFSTYSQSRRRLILHQNNNEVVVTPPVVQDYTYVFDPVSTGIAQGGVDDTTARNNRNILEAEMLAAVAQGDTIFEMPAMDAYFSVVGGTNRATAHDNAIRIPNGIHVKMNTNTMIYAQPDGSQINGLFSIWNGDNIKISGGTLIGDKYDHTYSQYYTVSSIATTTTATVTLEREHVATVYSIPVTVSDADTNASEIASYLNALPDVTASANGDEITLYGTPGLYVELNDDSSDTSGIDFSGGSTLEYGIGIRVFGGHNITVEGVTMKDFYGDGMEVGNTGLRNPSDGSLPNGVRTTENLFVTGCTFDNNRRQGLSVIDCNGVVFEYCYFINTGEDIYTLPACGVDVEVYNERDGAGNLLEYARAENITFRNCVFDNNYNTDLLLYNPKGGVEVHNNMFSKGIGNQAASGIHVHHNDFNYRSGQIGYDHRQGISASSYIIDVTGEQLTKDWEINDNTFTGYKFTIGVGGDNFTVYNNTINEHTRIGISLDNNLKNANIYDNTITSSVADADGIRNFLTASTLTDVTLNNNDVTMTGTGSIAFRLQSLNATGTGLTVTNSSLSGVKYDVQITNSNDVTFGSGNTYTTVNESGNTNVIIP